MARSGICYSWKSVFSTNITPLTIDKFRKKQTPQREQYEFVFISPDAIGLPREIRLIMAYASSCVLLDSSYGWSAAFVSSNPSGSN